jgi:hypothetical protein
MFYYQQWTSCVLTCTIFYFKSNFIPEQRPCRKSRELILFQVTVFRGVTLYNLIDEHETCYLHFQGTTVSDFSTREDGDSALLRNVLPFCQTAWWNVLKTAIFIIQCCRNLISQLTTVALVEPSIFEDWCRIVVLLLENMILPGYCCLHTFTSYHT